MALVMLPETASSESSDVGENTSPVKTVETSRWTCSLCPYRYGWWGEIDVGAGRVSKSSNKFGDYRGLNDEGGFMALDGNAHFRSGDGRYFDIVADDLGIDSRQLRARAGKRGRYSLRIRYREIPKYRGFGAESPYLGTSSGALTLPTSWQPASTTSEMSELTQTLQPIDLKTTRRIFDTELSWRLGQAWSWDADYQHQSKSGTRPVGAGVLSLNASHIPAPVDFSTDRITLGLNFKGVRSHWRAGFMSSRFKNYKESFTWQNPFTPLPGTEVLRSSLAPDNEAYRFDLAGAWSYGSRLRLSGSAAFGHMNQDDPLLPYSINPAFSDLPLPRLTADSRIDSSSVDITGRLMARISRKLKLDARWQHDQRDNKTPVDNWTPVITDFFQREPRPNRPYSFERQRSSVALRFRPHSSLGLQAGINRDDLERTLQSVEETQENSWFIEASVRAGPKAGLRARFESADRGGQPYLQVTDFALPEHPLMRKFNLADRDRDRLALDLDLYPSSAMSLNFSYRLNEDRFGDSILGLRISDSDSLNADLSWNPSRLISAHAFISQQTFNATLAGMEFGAMAPWVSTTEDVFLTAGIGLNVSFDEKTQLRLDMVSSEAEGDIRTNSGVGEAPFPTLETYLFNMRLSLDHHASQRWGLKLLIEYESYDSTDWALDGLGPDGVPAILTFGAQSPDYDVTVFRAQVSYRF